jgi:hypothetical protein
MESWMPYLIGVITLALVLQCIFLIAMFVAFRRASQRVEQIATELQGRINPILSRVQTLVDEVQPRIATLVNDVAEVTRVARTQAQHADRVVSEALERVRLQLGHMDQILTGTLETVEDTGMKLKRTVLAPVRSVTAMVRGIQTGLEFYRGRRRQVDGSGEQQDESLFI